MARRSLWLGLFASLTVAALVWTLRPGACDRPVAYRLDQVDERFGLTRDEVGGVLRQAEEIWERAVGRDLFVQTPTAELTVNLIYDERQQRTQVGDRLRGSMRKTAGSYESAGRSYAEWRDRYERRLRDYTEGHAEYEARAQVFNAQMQEWNARGGAPPDERARLEAERSRLGDLRQRLELDRAALQDLATAVSGLADKSNAIALTHNRSVATFNALYGEPRLFHKGEFDGRQIAVFEFHDRRDLILLLAHELGHALGLHHVEDPTAIMHAVGGGQLMEPPAPTRADLAVLRTLCPRL